MSHASHMRRMRSRGGWCGTASGRTEEEIDEFYKTINELSLFLNEVVEKKYSIVFGGYIPPMNYMMNFKYKL